MSTSAEPRRSVVIDLVSSDDEDEVVVMQPRQPQQQQQSPPRPDTPPPAQALEEEDLFLPAHDFFEDAMPGAYPEFDEMEMNGPPTPPEHRQGGQIINIDGEDVFIPDESGPEVPQIPQANNNAFQEIDQGIAQALDDTDWSADGCLRRVLDLFPDISHEHVHKMYNDFDGMDGYEALSGQSRLENIIDKLASGEAYPKQDKGKRPQKRKREDEDEDDDIRRLENANREALPGSLKGAMSSILKAEFPEVPTTVIARQLTANKHLYQTYIAISRERDDPKKKWHGRPSMRLGTADNIADSSSVPDLKKELEAARKRVQAIRVERAADEARKRDEAVNLQEAIERGETAECQACFDDLPMNRQIHCDGDTAHFTCFECATAYIKSEVGESRCRVLCTAGCGAGFAHAQLHLLDNKQLLERLETLQQEKDIRDAGLDNLEECPFCDYKAILPPVEEDFEFRCANPECEKVSCRRCKAVSHIPKSCQEHAKDNKLSTRHKIEEAMTAAMIRSCNKCKKQFIKDYGCNKMTCPSCGNLQCYVCSESTRDYDHFEGGPSRGRTAGGAKKCPLYDNVEERHEREVKEAEAAARQQAMQDDPDVSEKDLEIKVSDAVKKATHDRIQRNGQPGGIPADFGGGLFPAHHGHFFEDPDADEDEDDEDDVADHPFVARRQARAQNVAAIRRNRALGLAIRNRLGAGARRLGELRAPLPAQPQAAQQPNAPAANAMLGPVQGVIPVYGLRQQPLPNFNAVPQAPGPNYLQGHVLGHQHGGPDFLDAFFEDPFGGGDADPFALHRVMNGPPVRGIQHPEDPRLQAHVDRGNAQNLAQRQAQQLRHLREQEQNLRNALARTHQERVDARRTQGDQARNQAQQAQLTQDRLREHTDAMQQARAQQLRAVQNMHNRAGRYGQIQNIPPGDPRRHHQPRGFPGAPQTG